MSDDDFRPLLYVDEPDVIGIVLRGGAYFDVEPGSFDVHGDRVEFTQNIGVSDHQRVVIHPAEIIGVVAAGSTKEAVDG